MAQTVVLGAGPAGLGAAWESVNQGERDVLVLELKERYGGLAGTFQRNGFRLDFGPHKFYTQFDYLLERIKTLMGPDLLTVEKISGVWLLGRRFEYPVGVKDLVSALPRRVAFRCGMTYLRALATQRLRPRPDVSYEDYLVSRFGRGVYELVFEPLADKVWGDPASLDAGLARVRVVIPSLGELLKRMLFGDRGKEISSKVFYYPRQGFMEFWHRIVGEIEQGGGRVQVNAKPLRLSLERGRVASIAYDHDGRRLETPASRVVSTIPLAALLRTIDPPPPQPVLDAAAGLRYRASILLFLVVGKPRLLRDCWMFFPERRYIFNRISEQKAFSEAMVPGPKTVLTVDISSDLGAAPWTLSDETLFERSVEGLEEIGVLSRGEVTEYFTVRIPQVYPIYNVGYRERMRTIWAYLDSIPNLISAGRHGYFQHNNSDNALDMGIQALRHLLQGAAGTEWQAQRERFDQYQIVD